MMTRIKASSAAAGIAAAIALSHVIATQTPILAAPVDAAPSAVEEKLDVPTASDIESTNSKIVSEQKAQSRKNTRVSGEASQAFARATKMSASGDSIGAEAVYREVIAMAPTFAPARSNLGNLLVARGAYTEAIQAYTESLSLAPRAKDSWVVYVNRGTTRLAMGDVRMAIEDMNAAEKLTPGEPAVLANRGTAWESLGKWDNALRDYQGALRGSQIQPFWLRYALVLHERGRSVEALGILNRLAAKVASDDVFAAQAAVHFDRGDISLAEGAWSSLERPRLYEKKQFLTTDRRWPPKAVDAIVRFRGKH